MPLLPLHVNGQTRRVDVDDPDMPLLYALRDILNLKGPRFGCGLAQCGACTVHIDGQPVRSCVMPLSSVGTGKIVTLEGLGTPEQPHPLQQAFIDEQAVQCGYCINGMIMQSAALPAAETASLRRRHQASPRQQSVSLRHPSADHPRCGARRTCVASTQRSRPWIGARCCRARARSSLRSPSRAARAGADERTPQEIEAPETAATKSVSAEAVQGFLAIDPSGQVTSMPERSISAPALRPPSCRSSPTSWTFRCDTSR